MTKKRIIIAAIILALLFVPFIPFPTRTTDTFLTVEVYLFDYYVGASSPGYGYIQQVSFHPIQTSTLAGMFVSYLIHPNKGWVVKRTYPSVLNQDPQIAVFHISVRLESATYDKAFNSTSISISDLYQHYGNCTVEIPGLPTGNYTVQIGLYLQNFGRTSSQNLTLIV